MRNYETLVEAINDLIQRGYYEDFNLVLKNTDGKMEVVIDEYHRFEGMSDPADNSVVFALRSSDGRKGVLVDAFGAYANEGLMKLQQAV